MEKKGWNEEYLRRKIEEHEFLIENSKNDIIKKQYEEQLFSYQLLYTALICNDGKITYPEVSTEDFLEEFNEEEPTTYDQSIEFELNSISKQFISMPRLQMQEYKQVIKREDIFELIEEFIKSTFGLKSYLIYEKYFLKNMDYVLFNNLDDDSSLTTIDEKEHFIKVPSSNDINMLAKTSHEIGHLTRRIINPVLCGNNFLNEFESYSYEIGILLWMIKNHFYEDDAKNYLINAMDLVEKLTMARYYNIRYKLNKMQSAKNFDKTISNLDLIRKIGVNKKQDLFDLIGTSLDHFFPIPTFLISFLCVINNINDHDFLHHYESVINSICKENADVTLKRLKRNNVSNLDNYKKFRDYFQN